MKNRSSKKLLALAALLLGLSSLASESTPPATSGDGTVNFVTNGNGQVVTNPDGSKTYIGNWATTNENTGKTWNTNNTTTVEKTGTGSTWQRASNTTNTNGGSCSTQTSGSSVNNGNGSGTWSSTTTGEAAGPNGREADWTTQRNGSWEKNTDGSVGFQRTADTTFKDGATVDRQTTGAITKTSNGYDKESTTTGVATGPKGKQVDWTTARDTEIVNNGNGTKTINEQVTRTNSNGQTTTIDKTGELVKEGNGKWEYEGGGTVSKNSSASGGGSNTGNAITAARSSNNSAGAEKPQMESAAHQQFRGQLGEFRKQWENYRFGGGPAAGRAALQSQFDGLQKKWEGLKAGASEETARHWERLNKDWEEERGRGHRR